MCSKILLICRKTMQDITVFMFFLFVHFLTGLRPKERIEMESIIKIAHFKLTHLTGDVNWSNQPCLARHAE